MNNTAGSNVRLAIAAFGISISMTATAFAIGPASGLNSYTTQPKRVVPASFYGRPYPYGYTSWGHCIRYVPVETPAGIRWKRISVCRGSR